MRRKPREPKLITKLNQLYTIIGESKPSSIKKIPVVLSPLPEYIHKLESVKVLEDVSFSGLTDEELTNSFHTATGLPYFAYPKLLRKEYAGIDPEPGRYENRFHIYPCSFVRNYESRYIMTTRHDGLFHVRIKNPDGEYSDKIMPLRLCKFCYDELYLDYQGYHRVNFDIQRYYMSEVKKRIKTGFRFQSLDTFMSRSLSDESYAVNWPVLSRSIKENRGWECERCHFRAESYEQKKFLEVHHKNRNKYDNRPENLEVICRNCHDKEHPHRPKRY